MYALNIDHLMTISAICCLVCTVNITLDLSRKSFEYSPLSQDLTSLCSLTKNRSLTTRKILLTRIRNKELQNKLAHHLHSSFPLLSPGITYGDVVIRTQILMIWKLHGTYQVCSKYLSNNMNLNILKNLGYRSYNFKSIGFQLCGNEKKH